MSEKDSTAVVPMVRHASDDMYALYLCEAMVECGGRPFSVVIDPNPALVPVGSFDAIDEAYDRRLDREPTGDRTVKP